MKQILSLALLFVVASTAVAQTKGKEPPAAKAERELLKVNQEYDYALVRGDTAALNRIYGDEYTYTSSSGAVLNKAQQIEVIRSGALKIESGASERMEVRLYSNTALVLGYFKAKGQYKGEPFDLTERFTSVWSKRGGRWQIVAEHVTTVPNQ